MIIDQNSTPEIVFLLVRERDAITGIENAQNIRCSAAPPGGKFVAAPMGTLRDLGGGWYGVMLPATATAQEGPLIFLAESDDSYQWRDIHQVRSSRGGCSCDEVATLIDEALSVQPVQELDIDALIDMTVEALSVESELVRRDQSTSSDPPPDPPKQNLLLKPIPDWTLYCGGEIVRTPQGEEGVEFRRQGNAKTNCQTYTVQAFEPGDYQLIFVAKATPAMALGLALIQHSDPYLGLGLDVQVEVDGSQGGISVPFTVANAEPNARLRFWLAGMPSGGELRIENVRIERA